MTGCAYLLAAAVVSSLTGLFVAYLVGRYLR